MTVIDLYVQQPEAFDPEILSAMSAAYERALRSLPAPTPAGVRETLASLIIGRVRAGERDPDRLYELAVSALHGAKQS